MHRILITGHKGMLGREIVATAEKLGLETAGIDLPECDITDRAALERAVRDAKPDLIIHAAAFAQVDRCESEPELAYRVNATGTQNVCLAAQPFDIPLLYVSTDYVFDGSKNEPYDESDAAGPLSVYGKSKYAGECFVRDLCAKHFIVRTSWLCGHGGPNFVETLLKLAKERDELKVVNDQHGSPTFAVDLAPELLRLSQSDAFGTYHITNQGYTTWFGFAGKIIELSGLRTRVVPCTTEEFPRPAPRPKNSQLSPRLYENALGMKMPSWEKGLKRYLKER
ncbi:dTDP-4-dehydrorhamnose reductase [bacterium]|nr:dTDP-4-dehydrorhamnose reductase [bacterium]MBU1983054.1 dTDP-4-dehydrorhamnose reductase [bacterium]